jgi:hypothetical protein
MGRFEKFLKYAGAVSALVALISLVVTLVAMKRDADSANLREWQEVAVFQVIEKAGKSGISFDKLRDAYLNDAQVHEDFNISKKDLQVPALKRVLLGLLAKKVAIIDASGNYAVLQFPDPPQLPAFERQGQFMPVVAAIIGLVRDNEGELTESQIFAKVQPLFPKVNVSPDEFTTILTNIVSQGGLTVEGGKFKTVVGASSPN